MLKKKHVKEEWTLNKKANRFYIFCWKLTIILCMCTQHRWWRAQGPTSPSESCRGILLTIWTRQVWEWGGPYPAPPPAGRYTHAYCTHSHARTSTSVCSVHRSSCEKHFVLELLMRSNLCMWFAKEQENEATSVYCHAEFSHISRKLTLALMRSWTLIWSSGLVWS